LKMLNVSLDRVKQIKNIGKIITVQNNHCPYTLTVESTCH